MECSELLLSVPVSELPAGRHRKSYQRLQFQKFVLRKRLLPLANSSQLAKCVAWLLP